METAARLVGGGEAWPALHFNEWADTCATLHMWTQIVGKVRLALAPLVNHWWEVPLYVSARGLNTSPIPYKGRVFEVEFDFIDHQLTITTCENDVAIIPLEPRTCRRFLCRIYGRAALSQYRSEDLADARGDSRSDSIRPGSHA